jgi:hypothetical protein
MRITADLGAGRLRIGGGVFPISNRLRTLREGTRKSTEVVTTIPDKLPYDPLPFPRGVWRVTGIHRQKEKGFDYRTYGPVKILTDAWQEVETWELDAEGDYLRPSGQKARDTCYWLHWTSFSTTLGCIRLASPEDAETIAGLIEAARERGEPVELEAV